MYEPRLFREEALVAKRTRLLGELVIHPPPMIAFTSIVVGVLVASLIAFLSFGTYSRQESAPGILVTDIPSEKVVGTKPGRISQLLVKDGDFVKKGQILAKVIMSVPDSMGIDNVGVSARTIENQQKLSVDSQRLALQRQQSDLESFKSSIAGLAQEASDLNRQMAFQRGIVSSLTKSLSAIAPAMKQGYVSRLEFEGREQSLLTSERELSQLEEQYTRISQERQKLASDAKEKSFELQSSLLNLKATAEGLESQRAQLAASNSYAITAPISGTVTSLQVGAGATIDGLLPLLDIVPNGSLLHAELYAPSRAVGFVQPGQEVKLLIDAFPYEKFGSSTGIVERVSENVLDPRSILAPIKVDEPVFRIAVRLQSQTVPAFGKLIRLHSGMTLKANLILERRSLAAWILEPFEAVTELKRS